MKTKKLAIFGVGEFAKIAYEYFTFDSDFEVVCFTAHREYCSEADYLGVPIVPFEEFEKTHSAKGIEVFVAIPSTRLNEERTKIFHLMKSLGFKLASYVSSKAFVWRNVDIGENCFIFENNVLQPFVSIGDNVILWSGNHIGHRTRIDDHVFVSSHAVISGYCKIGSKCFIGVNSTFNDHTSIAERCILGSGALVTKPLVIPDSLYVGVPAKLVEGKSTKNIEL